MAQGCQSEDFLPDKIYSMIVYKFGGASIATPELMKALLPLVREAEKPLLIVISAIGKTTNALEAIVQRVWEGDLPGGLEKAAQLEAFHKDYVSRLLPATAQHAVGQKLETIFTELHWAMEDTAGKTESYVYDQIVCIGELLSSAIFCAFLEAASLPAQCLDARDIIRTDSRFRDAVVDEVYTRQQVAAKLRPALAGGRVVVLQGFIGSDDNNSSTTLGREGSDYTAALMAAMLDARAVWIWKDVAGLLNADPRKFPDAVLIPDIAFYEVIEMAYYGAQVIHPKTIKPLQNSGIPLWVKSFPDPAARGTRIDEIREQIAYPPLIVLKDDQMLLSFTSRDYGFITESHLSTIYSAFYDHQLKINMSQNAAISLVVCVDNQAEKVRAIVESLEKEYRVLTNENVRLLTVRHYTPEVLSRLLDGKSVILEQKSRQTLQAVLA